MGLRRCGHTHTPAPIQTSVLEKEKKPYSRITSGDRRKSRPDKKPSDWASSSSLAHDREEFDAEEEEAEDEEEETDDSSYTDCDSSKAEFPSSSSSS